jgi:uncharacterized protein YecE (DUF72 family)
MVYAGTSGWAYTSWKPGFYPAKLGAANFLNYYATRLNSVEVNHTFTTFPTEEVLRRWMEATQPDFKFAIKAHYTITHSKRLRKAAKATKEFLASIRPLRNVNKLGPVLFQLPPNFKCDPRVLRAFLAGLAGRGRAAMEFRHVSWFTEEVYEALRQVNVALCLAESEKIETPDVSTADFSYLRLRKEKYSPGARKALAERVARLGERGDVFVYFKHGETPEGAKYARSLLNKTKLF